MNWPSLFGVIISFIGGLFVVSLELPVTKDIVKLLPSIKKVSSARNLLLQERDPIQNTIKQYIKSNEYGFFNLIKIVKRNKSNLSIGEPLAVFILDSGVSMGYPDIRQEFKFVFLGYNDTPRVPVGYLNIFDEWIKNYKQRFFLKWGFLIIIIGFAISIGSHFYKTQ